MAQHDLFVAWLKDAHGMEVALIPVLENHAQDAKNIPHMQERIEQHVQETRRHADMLEQLLKQHDEAPSKVKSAVGGLTGMMQSVSTAPFADELVKNGLMDFAAEQFEIACYTALIVAANELGETEALQVLEEIREDEMDMALWLEEQLPQTVVNMLQLKQSEQMTAQVASR